MKLHVLRCNNRTSLAGQTGSSMFQAKKLGQRLEELRSQRQLNKNITRNTFSVLTAKLFCKSYCVKRFLTNIFPPCLSFFLLICQQCQSKINYSCIHKPKLTSNAALGPKANLETCIPKTQPLSGRHKALT